MFQVICKLTLIFPLLFVGVLAALHVQPTGDEVRAFLLPLSDCAMPCWQGIQPGVTDTDQAVALLNASPWIKDVQVVERPPSTYIYWNWNPQKPGFAGDPRALIPPEIWGQNGIVQLIYIPTGLAYGEVSLLLGAAKQGSFAVSDYPNRITLATRPNTRHLAVYFDGSVSFDTRIVCPINLDLFWNAPVSVAYIGAELLRSQSIFRYDLPRWLYDQPCNL